MNEICTYTFTSLLREDREYAELNKTYVDYKFWNKGIKWDQNKPDGTPRKLMDISRITHIGWQPKISLEQGISLTYKWYCNVHKI